MVKFTTQTGSVYELDDAAKRVRRLTGRAEPTPRQGVDGRWRTYVDRTELRAGLPVVFAWSAHEGTTTSVVRTVEGA